jgi:hypothetical protein
MHSFTIPCGSKATAKGNRRAETNSIGTAMQDDLDF